MNSSLKFLLGILLVIIFFLNISFVSADPACFVETEANCLSPTIGGIVLMHISGSTNAHGALQSQSNFPSNLVVCCQDIGEGSYTCTDNNKIIGLSSAGNAHAERPEYDSQDYEDYVCYEFFSDVTSRTTNPGGDYIPILSLSSEGNSHIGSTSAYSLVVYGIVGEGGGEDECSLQDAYWENGGQRIDETNNYVLSSISVVIVVEGNELCNGETIDFEITEDSTSDSGGETSGEFSEGKADATWISQYMDLTTPNRPPRYFFTGEVAGITPIENGGDSVSLLTVYDSDNPVSICSEYTNYFEGNLDENEIICGLDPYEAVLNSVSEVDCDDLDINCSCTWDNDECKGAWDTGEGTCIIEDQKITNECDEEPIGTMVFSWTATWTGDEGSRPPECKAEDSKSVICPAEIPLPFFNAYNFLAALLLIAAVYFVLSFRKPKKRQVKKGKK